METKTTVYRNVSLGSRLMAKRVGKVPLALLVALLLVAGVVAAQVIGPMLSKPQTIQAVILTDGSGVNGIEATITYGVMDWHNTTATSSSGLITNVYIRLVVVGLKCSDVTANPSILTLKEKFAAASFTTLSPKDSTGAACVGGIQTDDVNYFDTLLTQNVPTTGIVFQFQHVWLGVPSGGAATTWNQTPYQ